MYVLILVAATIAVVIGIFIGVLYANRQRTQALKSMASSLSVTFSEKGGDSLMGQMSVFPLFS